MTLPSQMASHTTDAGGSLPGQARSNACRFCLAPLRYSLVDLGMSPLCESYLTAAQLNQMEAFYPLHAYVCEQCFLVQLQEYVRVEDIFTEYAYFSSYSQTWLDHARRYTDLVVERFALGTGSFVIELASNDGYLLKNFVERGIPVLGIEPAANVAAVAVSKGVPTRVAFFGRELARQLVSEGVRTDLLVGNNVLAQVPDLNDFVAGMAMVLKPAGVLTMEFPHLVQLMRGNQFDTIYHEHFSYFSLLAVEKIFGAHGLRVFDVEELPTHGGSLRIYACHADAAHAAGPRVEAVRQLEQREGLQTMEAYARFSDQVKRTKRLLLDFLIRAKEEGKTIAGYGAPGKGNTLLNYCAIRTDFLDYTVDRNPYKHGRFTPGTHIPIFDPKKIDETRPDYVLILPWNFRDEIVQQMSHIREWGGRFVVPIPTVEVIG